MTTTLVPRADNVPQKSGHPAGEEGGDRGRHIVVGVDGSEESKDALRWAAGQAQLRGASLDVVTCWQPPVVPYGVWAGYDGGEEARETVDGTVHEVLSVAEEGDVTVTVVEGDPRLALTEAGKNAELLVVGTRGHGLFAGFLLGSVSRYCVGHASCPVVVVPHCQRGAGPLK